MGDRSPRRWGPVALPLLLLAYPVALELYLLLVRGQPSLLILNLAQLVAPLAAAGLAVRASLLASLPRQRWSWALLAGASLVFTCGQLFWTFYEVGLAREVPTPSIADAVWYLAYPLGFVALMLQAPPSRGGRLRLVVGLDALIFVLGGIVMSWHPVILPTLQQSPDVLLAVVNMAWPAGSFFLAFALALLILEFPLERVPRWVLLLLAGVLVQVAADLGYASLVLQGTYRTGSLIDPLWPLAFALIGLAAVSYARCAADPGESTPGSLLDLRRAVLVRWVLPYLALPTVGVLLFQEFRGGEEASHDDTVQVLILAFLVIFLVFFRQLLTLLENLRLNRSLASLSSELEDRVERRTAELRRTTEELVSSQAQLLQAQKMETLGRLAGSVAHDFNNVLTAILGYADLLLSALPREEPSWEDAREIQQAGLRGAGLTRQLLAFSRRQDLMLREVDLNQVLEEMSGMLRRLMGEGVELEMRFGHLRGRVLADVGQIEQVILNLVVNARDAIQARPGGGRGRVSVWTADVELDEEHARRNLGAQAGPHVVLAIEDTGIGMSDEVMSRIFEPFFTTKAEGKGTGLGLSTSFGIIDQSGGHLSVQSRPGRGSLFRIYLPRQPAPTEARFGGPRERRPLTNRPSAY